jgi:hypothetical protein
MLVFISRALVLLAALSPALLAGAAEAAETPFGGVIDLAAADAIAEGASPGAQAGASVAFAGDFNGDHRQDYAVAMPGAKELVVVLGDAGRVTIRGRGVYRVGRHER